jgi:hypothetical protein
MVEEEGERGGGGIMKRSKANGDNTLHWAQQRVTRMEHDMYALERLVETVGLLEAQGDKVEYEPGDWRGRLAWVEGELEDLKPRLENLIKQTREVRERL